jgi:transposase InsO family protein
MLLLLLRALLVPRVQLALENIALRQQLAVLRRHVARPRLRALDRVFWVILRRLWNGWSDALALVQPATVVRWHRAGWQLAWRWRSRKKSGRPPVPVEVRELIRRLSRENRLWGAPRIRDELRLLGHHVAKSTVEKHMVRRRDPPCPTWRTFLREHASEILACDFFTIPTASLRSLTGFVVMELGRRRILACGVTAHPSGSWAAEIVRRAATSEKCRYLMGDRDPLYAGLFSDAARSIGLRQIVSAPRTPVLNPFAERVIGTLRRECLDHVIVLGQSHAQRLLDEFVDYYNAERPHQALDGERPVHRLRLVGKGPIVAQAHLGGLHHSYRRAA